MPGTTKNEGCVHTAASTGFGTQEEQATRACKGGSSRGTGEQREQRYGETRSPPDLAT